jgi:hypothetical protein
MTRDVQLFPASFLRTRQQLLYATSELLGAVDFEEKLGRTAQAEALGQLAANEILRCVQSLKRAIGLDVVASDCDQNVGRTPILGHLKSRNAGQAYAGIAEFAFEDGFDLLAQSFAEPLAMMLLRSAFHGRGENRTE